MTKKRQPDKVVKEARRRRDKAEHTRREEQRKAVETNEGGFPSFSLADLLFGWFTKKD